MQARLVLATLHLLDGDAGSARTAAEEAASCELPLFGRTALMVCGFANIGAGRTGAAASNLRAAASNRPDDRLEDAIDATLALCSTATFVNRIVAWSTRWTPPTATCRNLFGAGATDLIRLLRRRPSGSGHLASGTREDWGPHPTAAHILGRDSRRAPAGAAEEMADSASAGVRRLLRAAGAGAAGVGAAVTLQNLIGGLAALALVVYLLAVSFVSVVLLYL